MDEVLLCMLRAFAESCEGGSMRQLVFRLCLQSSMMNAVPL